MSHSLAVLSTLPVSTALPSGLNAMAVSTVVVRQWRVRWASLVAASQSRDVWSSLAVIAVLPSGLNGFWATTPPWHASLAAHDEAYRWRRPRDARSNQNWEPVSTALPSGLNATAVTPFWCGSGGPTDVPVAVSQKRAVESSLPVSAVLPSGLKQTAVTVPSCASGSPMGLPVAAFQSRAVKSSLPVSTILPSGLNATAPTAPLWSEQLVRWSFRWLRSRAALPVLSGAARKHHLAVNGRWGMPKAVTQP